MTTACQSPLFMGSPRQEYQSGLPFVLQGISWLGIEPASHFLHRQIDSLPLRYQWSMSPKLLCCVRLFVIPWTLACQAPLSMRFFRQEYWSGLPCPPPEDLPDPGIQPSSLTSLALAGGFFTTSATWEAQDNISNKLIGSLTWERDFWWVSSFVQFG